MATVYFTNNADSGDGSLRNAIAAAADGDVITYDDTAFSDTEDISIFLSSELATFSTKEVSLDGREKRIVLCGQGGARLFKVLSSSIDTRYFFTNIDFIDGSSDSYKASVNITRATVTFKRCRFLGAKGISPSAGLMCEYETVVTIEDSLISGCLHHGVKIGKSASNTVTIKRCTIIGNGNDIEVSNASSANVITDCLINTATGPGSSDILTTLPSTAGFVAPCPDTVDPDYWQSWDFRLTSESPYLSGAETVEAGDADLLGNPRQVGGALGAFEGSWIVGSKTISSDTTADYCEFGAGDVVEFQGAADTILRIAEVATVDGAEFTATNRSYFVTPPGTETGGSTFTNVVPCSGVAGISDLVGSSTSATAGNLTWSQQNSGVPVLVESKNTEDEWETVSATASSPFAVSAPALVGSVFRIFDGATFASVTIPAPSYSYAVQYQVVGGFRTHNVDQKDWRIIPYLVGVVDMDSTAKPGQAITLLARIYDALDNDTPLLNDSFNIANVVYSVEKRTKSIYQKDYTPVPGHENVEAGPGCVLPALTVDDGWDLDETGYNFILTPSTVANPIFPESGQYRVKVTISMNNENPITFYHEIQVYE